MSDEKRYTERDIVLAQREACEKLAREIREQVHVRKVTVGGYCSYLHALSAGEIVALAPLLFPLPKVTRPRVVKDPHINGVEWRYSSSLGRAQLRAKEQIEWRSVPYGMFVTPERIALWSDILANPTEEVEE